MIPQRLIDIFQVVCEDKDVATLNEPLRPDTNLRNDLQLDSLELAELCVRIEEAYGTDVFEDAHIEKVSDILEKLEQ